MAWYRTRGASKPPQGLCCCCWVFFLLIYVQVPVCVHMGTLEARGQPRRHLQKCCLSLLVKSAVQQAPGILFCTGITGLPPQLSTCEFWSWNSAPQACEARALPTEPSLQLLLSQLWAPQCLLLSSSFSVPSLKPPVQDTLALFLSWVVTAVSPLQAALCFCQSYLMPALT